MKTDRVSRLAPWALLAACSGDPTAPPAPPPTVTAEVVPSSLPASVPLEQFLAVQANVECADLFRCAPAGTAMGLRMSLGTYARCVENADELPNAVGRERTRRLAAMGALRYDGAAARRCLEALRAASCLEAPPAACAPVLSGTVPVGGACQIEGQCEGDAYCRFSDPETGYRCPGTCAARSGVGQRCFGDSSACSQAGAAAPVRCEYDPSLAGERYPFTCREQGGGDPAAEGEVCMDFSGSSRLQRRCAQGLECRPREGDGGVAYVCQGPAAQGEACSQRCRGDAVCEFDGRFFTQRCLGLVVRAREGETCVQGNQGGEICDVVQNLDCVAGRCRRVGTGAEGSPCYSSRYGLDNCRAGLFCNGATMACERRKADGMACRSAEECESRECVVDRAGMAPRCGVRVTCN